MIPLSVFLIGWFVFLGLYGIAAFLAVMQMLRHGLAGFGTVFSIAVFLFVSAAVILGTGSLLLTIDWTQSMDVTSFFNAPSL